jgi:hypothetical protein
MAFWGIWRNILGVLLVKANHGRFHMKEIFEAGWNNHLEYVANVVNLAIS